MKKLFFYATVIFLIFGTTSALAQTTKNYGDITLSGGFQSGHFDDVWDLATGDITITFTYDATGMVDDSGAHAWSELGVRSASTASDFNPYGTIYWAKIVELIAGQNQDIGDVVIQRVDNSLYITYALTDASCIITETHVAVADSLDGIPQTKKGNPIPGQFPFKGEHTPGVAQYTYTINAQQWNPGTKLFIAAHAEVTCGWGDESSWATTYDKEFEGANWATYVTYKPAGETPVNGSGIWLATDYEWKANTFDPDPVGAPSLDIDDKLILQRRGGNDEGYYDLPSSPAQYWNNYGFWFDRDGVDQWQALMWGCIDGGTYNTTGLYNVVITLHADDATSGTAYLTVNGIQQGFYNGPWYNGQPALYPVGQTFTGDMKRLQVFYGIFGYGTTHSVNFNNITVTQ
jgi:hypothetical protein